MWEMWDVGNGELKIQELRTKKLRFPSGIFLNFFLAQH
jgi:hypothetical protein